MQETSQIRWLMYSKSAIFKSGQFEFDSVINWKPDGEKRGALIDREPRTVIHVKRAKMFDPMG